MKTKNLTRIAVIAALYAALTLLLPGLSYGPFQFRLSEALTILPLFYWEAIPALTIGCFFANAMSTPWDMLFGTAATLVAAVLTYLVKKIYFGVIPPIVVNMFVVPVIFLLNPEPNAAPYLFNVISVGIGQLGVLLLIGIPFYFGFKSVQKRLPLLQ